MKRQGVNVAFAPIDGNGHDEAKLRLVDAFIDPKIRQLLMTSNVGRGECFKMATSLTLRQLHDESRYEYDEDDNLVKWISLDEILIEYLLLLKMSIGGKKGEQLTYLAEQEIYEPEDEMSNKWKKI